MNKWVVIPILVILAMATATNGVLYIQENNKLRDAQSQILALEGNYNTLEGDFSALDDNFSVLSGDFDTVQGNISSLEGNVSAMQDNVSSLGSNFSELEGNFSTLESGISGLEGDVSALEGNVSTLGDSVYTLDSKVSDMQGDVSAMAGDVSTLEGDVSALEAYDRAVMDVIAKLEPSVVRIVVDLGDGSYGSGSGVIITNTGWVLTCAHVLEDAESIGITLASGETYDGIDDYYVHDYLDIALVKIDSSLTNFPEAELGSSADVMVGEEVVAMGYPFWPEFAGQATFTTGIVSATNRTFGIDEFIEAFGDGEWIQFDAAINYGNSGGPLVNLEGKVIGINALSFKEIYDLPWEGLNLAIPIDDVLPFPEEVTG